MVPRGTQELKVSVQRCPRGEIWLPRGAQEVKLGVPRCVQVVWPGFGLCGILTGAAILFHGVRPALRSWSGFTGCGLA